MERVLDPVSVAVHMVQLYVDMDLTFAVNALGRSRRNLDLKSMIEEKKTWVFSQIV